jgi:aquaporin Z
MEQVTIPTTPVAAITTHWAEYAIEAAALGMFMVSACFFTVLMEYPASPVHAVIGDAFMRRLLIALAMGVTAVALITSPWGQRSGAHMNPAVTISFWTLGKIGSWDALFYVFAQFLGGMAGVYVSKLLMGSMVSDASVNFAVTVPGPLGPGIAFLAELTISAGLMYAVLTASNSPTLTRWTPYIAGTLVTLYITFEAPLSGMSINPARTVGSAIWAGQWTALWVYFAAPLIGMISAALLYSFQRGRRHVFCAKLHHLNGKRCIFRCNFGALDVR